MRVKDRGRERERIFDPTIFDPNLSFRVKYLIHLLGLNNKKSTMRACRPGTRHCASVTEVACLGPLWRTHESAGFACVEVAARRGGDSTLAIAAKRLHLNSCYQNSTEITPTKTPPKQLLPKLHRNNRYQNPATKTPPK